MTVPDRPPGRRHLITGARADRESCRPPGGLVPRPAVAAVSRQVTRSERAVDGALLVTVAANRQRRTGGHRIGFPV